MTLPRDPHEELAGLRLELGEWHRELAIAAEEWVTARAAGRATDDIDFRMQHAERQTRRLERRIRRREPRQPPLGRVSDDWQPLT